MDELVLRGSWNILISKQTFFDSRHTLFESISQYLISASNVFQQKDGH